MDQAERRRAAARPRSELEGHQAAVRRLGEVFRNGGADPRRVIVDSIVKPAARCERPTEARLDARLVPMNQPSIPAPVAIAPRPASGVASAILLDDDFEWLGHVSAPCLGRWDGWQGRRDGDGRPARHRRGTWRPGRPTQRSPSAKAARSAGRGEAHLAIHREGGQPLARLRRRRSAARRHRRPARWRGRASRRPNGQVWRVGSTAARAWGEMTYTAAVARMTRSVRSPCAAPGPARSARDAQACGGGS